MNNKFKKINSENGKLKKQIEELKREIKVLKIKNIQGPDSTDFESSEMFNHFQTCISDLNIQLQK